MAIIEAAESFADKALEAIFSKVPSTALRQYKNLTVTLGDCLRGYLKRSWILCSQSHSILSFSRPTDMFETYVSPDFRYGENPQGEDILVKLLQDQCNILIEGPAGAGKSTMRPFN